MFESYECFQSKFKDKVIFRMPIEVSKDVALEINLEIPLTS